MAINSEEKWLIKLQHIAEVPTISAAVAEVKISLSREPNSYSHSAMVGLVTRPFFVNGRGEMGLVHIVMCMCQIFN